MDIWYILSVNSPHQDDDDDDDATQDVGVDQNEGPVHSLMNSGVEQTNKDTSTSRKQSPLADNTPPAVTNVRCNDY